MMQLVFDDYSNFFRPIQKMIETNRKKNSRLKKGQVTFKDFVRFLVKITPSSDSIWMKLEHRIDRHWFHYYANCAPCDIHYDIIGKMETISEDTR